LSFPPAEFEEVEEEEEEKLEGRLSSFLRA